MKKELRIGKIKHTEVSTEKLRSQKYEKRIKSKTLAPAETVGTHVAIENGKATIRGEPSLAPCFIGIIF